MRKLEKVRKKANAISDRTEIFDRSKRKQIEQLYKRVVPKRPKKEYAPWLWVPKLLQRVLSVGEQRIRMKMKEKICMKIKVKSYNQMAINEN